MASNAWVARSGLARAQQALGATFGDAAVADTLGTTLNNSLAADTFGTVGGNPPIDQALGAAFGQWLHGAELLFFDLAAAQFAELLKSSKTILWNGPVGVFEFDQFGNGTKVLAEAIAASPAFSIAGGGDTLAAIDKYGVAANISYISTGGGAFLEFVEGKVLPAVEVLEQRAKA